MGEALFLLLEEEYAMNEEQIEHIARYKVEFNEHRDFVACHHISREMLLHSNEKQLAKCLATLSALAEQVTKERWGGYHKLHKKLMEQLDEIEHFPFQKDQLLRQLKELNEEVQHATDNVSFPIYLKV